MVTRSGRGGGGGSGVAMVGGIGSKIAGPEDVVFVELVIVVEGVGGARVCSASRGRREGSEKAFGGRRFAVAEAGRRKVEVHGDWDWQWRGPYGNQNFRNEEIQPPSSNP